MCDGFNGLATYEIKSLRELDRWYCTTIDGMPSVHITISVDVDVHVHFGANRSTYLA
jgi:hypothetical protein